MKTKIIILCISMLFGLTSLTKAQCVTHAGTDSVVCGLTINLNAEGNALNQLQNWTCASPGVTFSQPSSPTSTVTVSNPGTYTFTWTITDEVGSTCSDDVVITFYPIPTSNFVVTSPTCLGENVVVTYTGVGAQAFNWNFMGATPSTAVTSGPHTVYYGSPGSYLTSLVVVSAQGCMSPVTTQNVVINFTPPSNFTVTDSVCPDQQAMIVLGSGYIPGYYYNWTVFPSGVPSTLLGPGPHAVSWANPTNVTVTLEVTNPSTGCVSEISTMPIVVGVTNFAGEDFYACENLAQLNGPEGLTGYWTSSIANTTFSPDSSYPSAMATIPPLTTTSVTGTFTWHQSQSTYCNPTDDVVVTFTQVPHPYAGPDVSVCSKYAELNATPTTGNGYWTGDIGAWFDASNWPNDTIFCPTCYSDSNVVVYYPSENDTATYYWMEFNGSCYGYDSVNVYFGGIEPAITLVDPSSAFSCGNVYTGLIAQNIWNGTGYWYESDPNNYYQPSTFYVGTNPAQPDSVVFDAIAQGDHSFYWVTVNGPCIDTSAVVIVHQNYNVVSALVFFDDNQNGIMDTNELGISNQNLLLLPDSIQALTWIDGIKSFGIDTGTYTIEVLPESNWFATTDSIQTIQSYTPCSTDTLAFGLYSSTNYDFEVNTYASTIAPASIYYEHFIDIENNGLASASGQCIMIMDSLFSFFNSTQSYTINGNVIQWNFGIILPGQHIVIRNLLTSPDLSHLGDTLNNIVNVTSYLTEPDLSNNSDTTWCRIVASYDPNDKQVVPMGVTEHGYVLHGQELEYTVRFQNTGNYPAMNIFLRDTISNYLDLSTIQIKSTSHPMSWQFNDDREIVFTFSNIMLPFEDEDEQGSQGYVTYSISPYAGLAENTEVENTAYIYFDLNPPIVTNTTLNTYVSVIPMSAENISYEPAINIYPNPAISRLSWNRDLQTDRIRICTLQGKEILSIENPESNFISIEDLSEGVYIISIQSGDMVKHVRFVKQGKK